MATLVQVFAELFRSYGYQATLGPELSGASGRRHPMALLLERDTRRFAVSLWLNRQPLGSAFVSEFIHTVQDAQLDGGLLVSLGAVPETTLTQTAPHRIQVWDSRRTAQELGNAVLAETCPEAWDASDPLAQARPSRILEQVHAAAPPSPAPPAPAASTVAPLAVATPFPTEISTPPAPAPTPAPTELQLPFAFGVLDQASAPSPPAPALAPSPTPVQVPVVSPFPSPVPEASPAPARPQSRILRLQVNKNLAVSLAKPKTRTVDRMFLRLVPHYVYNYEAQLLVEGSLQTEQRQGRMGVDAALKKARPWTLALDTADLPAEGAEIDEKPVRVPEAEARKIVVNELRTLVTRAVVHEEDASEWSVVVRKKVELAADEIRLELLGIYWQPIWRLTGVDGSVEIDAATGQMLHEESSVLRNDAQLI